MAKPNQPKDIKPKEEGAAPKGKIGDNMKMIVINLATTVLICVLFLSVNYVLQDNLLNAKLAKPAPAAEDATATDGDSSGGGEEDVQRGIIVDLGDFILNLSDVSPRKYLKVNVALEVSKSAADTTAEAAPAKKEKEGEGGGAGALSPVEQEMAQFKPAIREAVNGLFAGEREVIRVSFGQFIIQ